MVDMCRKGIPSDRDVRPVRQRCRLYRRQQSDPRRTSLDHRITHRPEPAIPRGESLVRVLMRLPKGSHSSIEGTPVSTLCYERNRTP